MPGAYTDGGGGATDKDNKQTDRPVRPVQIWKCKSKERGRSFREKLDSYCVTKENICKLLTRPRHQEKRKTFELHEALKLLTHTHTETIQHKLLFNSGANSRTSLASEEGRAFDWIKMYSSTSAISTHTQHTWQNKQTCLCKAARVHLVTLLAKNCV